MIQFECPHCGAVLRVPDQAMGQRGKCPHCSRSLLVPHPPGHPAVTSSAPAPIPPDSAVQAEPAPSPPTARNPPAEELGELFSALSAQGSSGSKSDPLLEITKRTRDQNRASLVTGLVFLLVTIIGGTILFWYLQPRMEGRFLAEKVTTEVLRPRTLTPQSLGTPDGYARFLKQQRHQRVQINSQFLRSSLEALDNGLQVQISPTSGAELYRVDLLGKHQLLREFHAEQFKALEQARMHELQFAARDFFAQMETAPETLLSDPARLMGFRDRLILPGLVAGLGFRLAAFVGPTQYPCLGQDNQDRLLFAVPVGTNEFEIRERVIAGQNRAFPASLKFQVICRPPVEQTPQTPPEKDSPEIPMPEVPVQNETAPETPEPSEKMQPEIE